MILVGEAAARPAEHGNLDRLQGRHDVVADAAGVGDRAVLADPVALVDAVPQVLGEMAVDIAVDLHLALIGVDHERVGGFLGRGAAPQAGDEEDGSQSGKSFKHGHLL